MADQGVNVANLIATLKLDLSQFQGAVQQLDQNLQKMQRGIEGVDAPMQKATATLSLAAQAAQGLSLQGTVLGAALQFLLNPLTLIGAAVGAMGLAMDHAKQSTIETALEVRSLMAVSGLGAEAASTLGDTFKALGFSSDTVALAMFRLSSEIDSGGAGLGRLGIAVRNTAGDLKSEGALFLEARDRISELGTATERNAALQDLFGRSARALAPIFALNREEFVRFMERAAMFSPVSEKFQTDTLALIQSQNELKLAWTGMWNALGEGLAGPGTAFNKWLTDIVVGARDALKGLKEFMGSTGAFAVGPTGGGVPAPAGGADVSATVTATTTRRTGPEIQAEIALLAQRFQAQEQYFAKLKAIAQLSVAEDKDLREAALTVEIDDLAQRLANNKTYYANLRTLTIEQYGSQNAAAQVQLRQLQAQEDAAQSQLVLSRIAATTQLVQLANEQRAAFNAFVQSATAAIPVSSLPIDQLEARIRVFTETTEKAAREAGPDFAESIRSVGAGVVEQIKRFDALQQSLKALTLQLELDETAAKDYQKLVDSLGETFQKAADASLAFQRSQQVSEQFGAIQRGAGIPTDMTGTRISATQTRIQELLGQQADWNQQLALVDETSTRFDELTKAIETSAMEVGTLQTALSGLREIQVVKGIVSDVFGALDRAVTTSITGIIQGTLTTRQAFENMGQSILLSIQEMLIKRAFKAMEEGFDAMLDAMDTRAIASFAIRTLTQLGLSFAGPSANSTGTSPTGADITRGVGAEGGIVTQPTLALIGEHGREAVVPLDQMPGASPLQMGGGDGGFAVVNVYNYSGGETETKQSTNPDGFRQLEIIIHESVKRGMAGGQFDRTMQSTYGLTRQGVRR